MAKVLRWVEERNPTYNFSEVSRVLSVNQGHDISNPHSKCLASAQNAPVLSTAGGDHDSGGTSSIHSELSRSISSALDCSQRLENLQAWAEQRQLPVSLSPLDAPITKLSSNGLQSIANPLLSLTMSTVGSAILHATFELEI